MNSKYQHQQFITNLLETIDFIFFTRLGIGKTTVSNILRRKSEYLANFESNENVQKFRFGNKSKHDNLNDLMWDWFRQARNCCFAYSELLA
jgi:hypothetical protein